jgi:hypothetical protein
MCWRWRCGSTTLRFITSGSATAGRACELRDFLDLYYGGLSDETGERLDALANELDGKSPGVATASLIARYRHAAIN